jgi:hypothetical protein
VPARELSLAIILIPNAGLPFKKNVIHTIIFAESRHGVNEYVRDARIKYASRDAFLLENEQRQTQAK